MFFLLVSLFLLTPLMFGCNGEGDKSSTPVVQVAYQEAWMLDKFEVGLGDELLSFEPSSRIEMTIPESSVKDKISLGINAFRKR